MARVQLTGSLGQKYAGGEIEVEVEGNTVRRVIAALDELYPGIGEELASDHMAVAVNGDIHQDGLLEPVPEDAEVCFLPAIRGG